MTVREDWEELRRLQRLGDILGHGEITLTPVAFELPPIIKFGCEFEIGDNIYRGQPSENIAGTVKDCISTILEKLSG